MKGSIGCPARIIARVPQAGKPAALTCRHFEMHRSQFYRWLARYDKTRLVPLEPGSAAPK